MRYTSCVTCLFGLLASASAAAAQSKHTLDAQIVEAVEDCRTDQVAKLLRHGVSVETSDAFDDPLLMIAVEHRCLAVVNQLLQAGADPHTTDRFGKPVIAEAAGRGEVEIVRALVDAGAAKNAQFVHRALEVAIRRDSADVTQLILQAGADPNGRSRFGVPIIVDAVLHESPKSLDLLLAAGANPDSTDAFRKPLLLMAVGKQNSDLVTLLLDAGAAQNAAAIRSRALMFTVQQARDRRYRADNYAIASALLDHDVDPNLARDATERTVLIEATDQGALHVLVDLLVAGADPNLLDSAGDTALTVACRKGLLHSARLLVAAGADQHMKNREGLTPINEAELAGHTRVIAAIRDIRGPDLAYVKTLVAPEPPSTIPLPDESRREAMPPFVFSADSGEVKDSRGNMIRPLAVGAAPQELSEAEVRMILFGTEKQLPLPATQWLPSRDDRVVPAPNFVLGSLVRQRGFVDWIAEYAALREHYVVPDASDSPRGFHIRNHYEEALREQMESGFLRLPEIFGSHPWLAGAFDDSDLPTGESRGATRIGVATLADPWMLGGKPYFIGVSFCQAPIDELKIAEARMREHLSDIGQGYQEIWPVDGMYFSGMTQEDPLRGFSVYIKQRSDGRLFTYELRLLDHYRGNRFVTEYLMAPRRFPGSLRFDWLSGIDAFVTVRAPDGDVIGTFVVSYVSWQVTVRKFGIFKFHESERDHHDSLRAQLGNWKARAEWLSLQQP